MNGVTRVFDTGDHRIGGVQQQQGGTAGTVQFTSQLGTFDVSSLTEIDAPQVTDAPVAPPQPAGDPATIVAAIESLAGLHQRGILSDVTSFRVVLHSLGCGHLRAPAPGGQRQVVTTSFPVARLSSMARWASTIWSKSYTWLTGTTACPLATRSR